MSRLIDADALKDNTFGYAPPEMTWDRDDIEHKIDEMPTVDAIPVEWLIDRANDPERAPLYRRYAQMLYEEWQKEQVKVGGEIVANDKPLDIAKKIIKEHYKDYDCGIFKTPNIVGDPMETIYEDDSIEILGCYCYSYFEVFGLSRDDFDRLEEYYNGLMKEAR